MNRIRGGEGFDDKFARSVQEAGNIILAMLFEKKKRDSGRLKAPGDEGEADDVEQEVRVWSTKSSLSLENVSDLPIEEFAHPNLPILELITGAWDLGYINLQSDSDGPSRRLRPIYRHDGKYYPSLPLSIARRVLGADKMRLTSDGTLQLDGRSIPLNKRGEMILKWHGPAQKTYRVYPIAGVLESFLQMREGASPLIDPEVFRDKVVFIAGTAAGTYDLRVTPFSFAEPGVFIHATALDNILAGDFLRQAPAVVLLISLLLLCLLTAVTLVAFSSFKTKISLILLYAVAYYGLAILIFQRGNLWMDIVTPEAGIFVTFLSSALVEYFTEGKRKRQVKNIFGHYMTPSVVNKILEHPEDVKLGGEKKELSVFFSDVAGFTTISESLEPEKLVALLNRYLTAMTDIILKHEGFLDKYEGDAIMAVFGTPLDQPRHATLACRAALANQEKAAKLREEFRAEGYPEIWVRIGVNSGPMIVGNMGSQNRMDYTVMGDHVNLASRLEGANKQYGSHILIGENTYRLAREDIEAREIDRIRVKGRREPAVVYELLARKGELPLKKAEVVETYLEGLSAYQDHDWHRARAAFEQTLALDPEDGPSRVYLDRCLHFLEDPPPQDWDGVFELKTK